MGILQDPCGSSGTLTQTRDNNIPLSRQLPTKKPHLVRVNRQYSEDHQSLSEPWVTDKGTEVNPNFHTVIGIHRNTPRIP